MVDHGSTLIYVGSHIIVKTKMVKNPATSSLNSTYKMERPQVTMQPHSPVLTFPDSYLTS